jgi:hypothetical protein
VPAISTTGPILCVNPWIHDFAAYDFWAQPVGLLQIAGFLIEHGFTVHFMDFLRDETSEIPFPKRRDDGRGKFIRTPIELPRCLKGISMDRKFARYGLPLTYVMNRLHEMERPAVILVTSVMTYWYTGVIETIAVLKSVFPETPIILGGLYATICEEHARAFSGATIIHTGSPDERLCRILTDILGREVSAPRPDETPIALRWPAMKIANSSRHGCLVTSRGCPQKCHFCISGVLYPRFRQRNPMDVVTEIKYCRDEMGLSHFAFFDDALFYRFEAHMQPILETIIDWGKDVYFHCPNGLMVRHITSEVARIMKASGFLTIKLGLESIDMDTLRSTHDKTSMDDFARAVENLVAAGYEPEEIGTYLMVGLPGQTLEGVKKSIDFVKSLGVLINLNGYSPVPHTPHFEEEMKTFGPRLVQEPLWQNNTLMPYRSRVFTPAIFRDLVRSLALK